MLRAVLILIEGARASVGALWLASILEHLRFLCLHVFGGESVEVLGVSLSKLEVGFLVSLGKLLEILFSLHSVLLQSSLEFVLMLSVPDVVLWLASRFV